MVASSGEDAAALDRLVDDERFRSLDSYVPPFSLLRALNVARDELSHSRLLAALFDPRVNRQAPHALHSLLGATVEELHREGANENLIQSLVSVQRSDLHKVATERERDLMDVVVTIDGSTPVLIAIENKIDATEQPDQIRYYQESVAERCVNRIGIVVFLTPTGRPPETANPQSAIPVVSLSYAAIAQAVQTAQQHSASEYSTASLRDLHNHIREEILGEASVKDRTRSIWKEHSRALRVLLKHKPELQDIEPNYSRAVSRQFGKKVTVTTYPSRGTVSEIKFHFPAWRNRGCDLVFMLHTQSKGDADGRPRFRVLVRNSWYANNRESLETLARSVNQADVELQIDEKFQQLRGWAHWRRVLKEDELYPERAVLGDVVIPGETDTEAVERATELVETLRPFVEALPSR